MRSSFGKQVLGLVGFTVAGLMLFTGLFYMGNYFQPGAVTMAQAGTRVPAHTASSPKNLYLKLDMTNRYGETWLTYRGKIDADHFLIDVTIPELDPQTRYQHKLKIADARKGFSLVGQAYRLVGMNKTGIRLIHG